MLKLGNTKENVLIAWLGLPNMQTNYSNILCCWLIILQFIICLYDESCTKRSQSKKVVEWKHKTILEVLLDSNTTMDLKVRDLANSNSSHAKDKYMSWLSTLLCLGQLQLECSGIGKGCNGMPP